MKKSEERKAGEEEAREAPRSATPEQADLLVNNCNDSMEISFKQKKQISTFFSFKQLSLFRFPAG